MGFENSGQAILLQTGTSTVRRWEWSGQGANIYIPQTFGVWTYLTGTMTEGPEGSYYLYENGVLAGSILMTGSDWSDMGNDDLEVGREKFNQRYYDGMFDELRISKVVRSSDWHKTSYNTMGDPDSFFSVGPEKSKQKPYINKPFLNVLENYHNLFPILQKIILGLGL